MKGQHETDRQPPAYPCETCGQRDGYCDWKACERHGRWFAVYWGNVRRIAQGLRRRRDAREQQAAQQNLAALTGLAGLAGQAARPADGRQRGAVYGAVAARRGMGALEAQGTRHLPAQGALPAVLESGRRYDPKDDAAAYGAVTAQAAQQERRA